MIVVHKKRYCIQESEYTQMLFTWEVISNVYRLKDSPYTIVHNPSEGSFTLYSNATPIANRRSVNPLMAKAERLHAAARMISKLRLWESVWNGEEMYGDDDEIIGHSLTDGFWDDGCIIKP